MTWTEHVGHSIDRERGLVILAAMKCILRKLLAYYMHNVPCINCMQACSTHFCTCTSLHK